MGPTGSGDERGDPGAGGRQSQRGAASAAVQFCVPAPVSHDCTWAIGALGGRIRACIGCGSRSGASATVVPEAAIRAAPGAPGITVATVVPAGTNRRPAAVILETPGPPPEPSWHSIAGSTSVWTVRVNTTPPA
jgi:hypothetical protein